MGLNRLMFWCRACSLMLFVFGMVNQAEARPQKISIVLFRYSDSGAVSTYSPKNAWETVFVNTGISIPFTMAQYVSKASYGTIALKPKTSIDGKGDIWPKRSSDFTSNGPGGFYQTTISKTANNIEAAVAEAMTLAKADGLQLGPDDLVIVGAFRGTETIGGRTDIFNQIVTMSSLEQAAWANVVHEIGHIYGGQHSDYAVCANPDPNSFTGYGSDPLFTNCKKIEYGGLFSSMGGYTSVIMSSVSGRLWTGTNRLEQGFIQNSSVTQVNQSGVYPVNKINFSSATLLKVTPKTYFQYLGNRIDWNESIYIESRDFESWEQGADTAPHQDVIYLQRFGSQLIGPNNNLKSNVIAPSEQIQFSKLGIKVKNLGATSAQTVSVQVDVQPQEILKDQLPTPVGTHHLVEVKLQNGLPYGSVPIKNAGPYRASVKLIPSSIFFSSNDFATKCPRAATDLLALTRMNDLASNILPQQNGAVVFPPALAQSRSMQEFQNCSSAGNRWIAGVFPQFELFLTDPNLISTLYLNQLPEQKRVKLFFYHGYTRAEAERIVSQITALPAQDIAQKPISAVPRGWVNPTQATH